MNLSPDVYKRQGIPGCELGITNGIIKTHVDNFAGNDKVLLLKDTLQKEEAFFAYEENQLVMQKGYYVYYERNDAMQEYMISLHEKEEKKGEVYDDKVTRNIRAVLAQKKTETVQKRVMGFLYGGGTFLTLIIDVYKRQVYDKIKLLSIEGWKQLLPLF